MDLPRPKPRDEAAFITTRPPFTANCRTGSTGVASSSAIRTSRLSLRGVFRVRYTEAARDDLLRLFDHLLERASTAEELDQAQAAIDAIRAGVETNLARAPFIYRKAGVDPFLRELVIPFGSAGYGRSTRSAEQRTSTSLPSDTSWRTTDY